MKGFIIDPSNFTIQKENIDYDPKIVDQMYVRVGKDLIPAAYVFPNGAKSFVEASFALLLKKKKDETKHFLVCPNCNSSMMLSRHKIGEKPNELLFKPEKEVKATIRKQ